MRNCSLPGSEIRDPDPLRSFLLLNLAFKICSLIFDKIFSSKAILNFFLICYSYVRMLKNCKINGLKAMNFGDSSYGTIFY